MDYYRLGYTCPYFNRTDEDKVICERGCRIMFDSHTEAKHYLHYYCCSHWKKCTIARMLEEYWEIYADDQ